jgi:hypothetical protein
VACAGGIATAGTTGFVPAGSPHTYRVTDPSRYLIFLTPRLDHLIARLRSPVRRQRRLWQHRRPGCAAARSNVFGRACVRSVIGCSLERWDRGSACHRRLSWCIDSNRPGASILTGTLILLAMGQSLGGGDALWMPDFVHRREINREKFDGGIEKARRGQSSCALQFDETPPCA